MATLVLLATTKPDRSGLAEERSILIRAFKDSQSTVAGKPGLRSEQQEHVTGTDGRGSSFRASWPRDKGQTQEVGKDELPQRYPQ